MKKDLGQTVRDLKRKVNKKVLKVLSIEQKGQIVAMRDIDINRIPSEEELEEEEEEEEYCNNNNNNNIEEEDEEEEDEEDNMSSSPNRDGRRGSSKRRSYPKRKLRLTKEQSFLLEDTFRLNKTLNPKQKEVLAMRLYLKPRQVEVWFQNRRARSKVKQTEVECDYLKRWFNSLTEQNKRLHKEVEELRAIQVISPHTSHHLHFPVPASASISSSTTTMTMCPRCERVKTPAAAAVAGINWLKMDI